MNEACASGQQCCSSSCTLGACDCSPPSARCKSSWDCCDSLSPVRCQAGSCVSGCRADGDVCSWSFDCCSNNCDATGHCAPPCVGPGAFCTASSGCCQGYGCPAGTCTSACGFIAAVCTTSNDCCSGYGCRAGECQVGYCGTWAQTCASQADCCDAAHGGKNYKCVTYGLPTGVCTLSQAHEACTTAADCVSDYPCRNGYCDYPDRSIGNGGSCLDDLECASGHCTSTAPGVLGICCSGAGTSCVAGGTGTVCCSPLACTGPTGAQTCSSCLGPENSGTGQANQCTVSSQCCPGQSLACDTAGKCCEKRGTACASTAQCCTGDACGSITTYQGTQASVCCGDFQAGCGLYYPCCDGQICSNAGAGYPYICLKAPGQACTADAECADYEGCKIATPPTGTCCAQTTRTCASNADCCSGICDASHFCQSAPPYGQCLTDGDCQWMLNTSFAGKRCGGNASVGPLNCCPAPGQTCLSAADCCEASDDCQVLLNSNAQYYVPKPVCCRGIQKSCTQDYECCTGACSGVPGSTKCCAYAYMTSFVCASDADCCSVGSPNFAMCDLAATPHARCCLKAGYQVGSANAALCCSGRVSQLGDCR